MGIVLALVFLAGFFTTPDAVQQHGASRSSLFQGLQVAPHPQHGYRPRVGVYVLNEDSGNIAGFRFSDDGDLSSIPHSSQSLATPGRGGVSAQIGFTPDRRFLTVTERCFQTCSLAPFGLIDTFRMGWDGRPGLVQAHPSDAPIPFGFGSNRLIFSPYHWPRSQPPTGAFQ